MRNSVPLRPLRSGILLLLRRRARHHTRGGLTGRHLHHCCTCFGVEVLNEGALALDFLARRPDIPPNFKFPNSSTDRQFFIPLANSSTDRQLFIPLANSSTDRPKMRQGVFVAGETMRQKCGVVVIFCGHSGYGLI